MLASKPMMGSDLRRAVRNLVRSPRFAIAATGSLALGIAAASAIFTFVHSILLAPLPFPASDRLISIQELVNERPAGANPLRMVDWLAAPSIESVAGYYGENYTVRFGDLPERVRGVRTFGDFLRTLNVQPAAGRSFTEDERQGRGGEVAVITDAAWKRHFGGDPSTIGRKIVLNGHPCVIIGVLPPGSQLHEAEIMAPEPKPDYSRRARFMAQIARLRPGAGIETARAEIETVASRLRRQYPDSDAGMTVHVVTLREATGSEARLPLLILMGAVLLLVLMASVNVANLYVAKIAGRSRELAICQALGASRLALIRLLFAESALIVAAGGVLGLVGAAWAVDLLVRSAPAELSRLNEVKLDATGFAFTALVTLACGLLSGLLPAWRQSGTARSAALKDGARGSSQSRRFQGSLVATQIALSLALTVGGGLLFRSLWNLERRPLGFASDHLLSFRLSLPWQTAPERLASTYERVLDRLRSIPGVEGAELTDRLPLDGDTQSSDVEIGGRNARDLPEGSKLGMRAVSAGFHKLMSVPLLAGRYLESSDSSARRALINESCARLYFAGENPLGRLIGFRSAKASTPSRNLYEIAGIVADLPDNLNTPRPEPAMYVPFNRTFWPLASFVVKTRAELASVAATVRREVAAVDSSFAIEQLQTVEAYLAAQKQTPRLEAWLMGVFAAVAMLLAGIGVYGLVAGSVEDRSKEIGIRIALGAEPVAVMRETLARLLRQIALGIAIGLVLAALVARGLEASLYNVTARDLPAYAGSVAVLSLVALCAAWWPARRAARLDAAHLLRRD